MNIEKQRIADCDRSTDDEGRFTSPAWEWAVFSEDGEEIAVFGSEEEADAFVAAND